MINVYPDYIEVLMSNGKFTKMSSEDLPIAESIMIHCIKNAIGKDYACFYLNGKKTMLSRYILDCPEGLVVDHINHDCLDNRRCNLRNISQSKNMLNSSVSRTNTGVRGITKTSETNFKIYMKLNNHRYYFTAKTLQEAKNIRLNFLVKLGEVPKENLDELR